MVNFGEKSSKITVFSDDFSPKLTKVRPKSVSWRSNQEWPSICADTLFWEKILKLEIHTGKTIIHFAASKGLFQVCELIIDTVQDKNPLGEYGVTPLHCAVLMVTLKCAS